MNTGKSNEPIPEPTEQQPPTRKTMNLNLEISAADRARLKILRQAIAAEVAVYDEARRAVEQMEKHRPKLAAEVEHLERNIDPFDVIKLEIYSPKLASLTLLDKQRPFKDAIIAAYPEKLFEVLRAGRPAIIAAVEPTLNRIKSDVHSSLRAAYGAGVSLEQAVDSTPVVYSSKNGQF